MALDSYHNEFEPPIETMGPRTNCIQEAVCGMWPCVPCGPHPLLCCWRSEIGQLFSKLGQQHPHNKIGV
jgi:hypothetical protein